MPMTTVVRLLAHSSASDLMTLGTRRNAAQVPFRPRMDRPVYCSDCFRATRSEAG